MCTGPPSGDGRYVSGAGIHEKQYNVPAVEGSEFRPVAVPTDSERGGLIGQAAFLKLTSSTFASSPIHRGLWILNNLYGDKMEPRSDLNIEEPDIRGTTTVKEVLQRHQQSITCNRCHSKIDPLGFATGPEPK